MHDDNDEKKLTRRAFLTSATGAALVGAAGFSAACGSSSSGPENKIAAEPSKAPEKKEIPAVPDEEPAAESRSNGRAAVVLVRDKRALKQGGEPDAAVLGRMLDEAMAELLGKPAELGWKELFRSDDVVGIKSNVWRFLPTPQALEEHIQDRLREVGVGADKIAVDDRGVRDNPVFEKATALINVRPMRTHHWSGVGSLIKNYITFAEDLPSWHPDSCANLAGLWDLPQVKGKTRLCILVMLTPLFHSKGPHDYQAEYTWPYCGLLVGTDPVALDATGMRILMAKRKEHFGKEEPLVVSPKHIQVARDKFELGVFDAARIDVKKLGWEEGILI